MPSSNIVYVITGANKGIGLALFEAYLSRPSTTVVGTVRSIESANTLKDAAEKASKGAGSSCYIVLLNFTNIASREAALEDFSVATNGAIDHVNTLICSAGHVTPTDTALDMKAEHLRECFEVNTIGPLNAFQTLWPLIQRSSSSNGVPPKYIVLSSSVGSIGDMEPFPGGAYGPSKAAVNHIVKSLHLQMEEFGLVSVALHPGWVKTDMGRFVADQWGFAAGPPDSIEDSVKGILSVVDNATRENMSGKFVTQTGEGLSW